MMEKVKMLLHNTFEFSCSVISQCDSHKNSITIKLFSTKKQLSTHFRGEKDQTVSKSKGNNSKK